MVVWQMPCESSSPPGSQLSQKAQSHDWAFLHFIPMRQIGREPIWTANGGSRRDETQDGSSTVVHRQADKRFRCRLTAQIQNQSVFKIPNIRPEGMLLQAIAPYALSCKSIPIQTDIQSQGQLMSGKLRNYSNNVFIALSRLLNAILGGNPSLTLSARAGLNYRKGQWRQRRRLINTLFWLQQDHCEFAIQLDTDRNQQAITAVEGSKTTETEPLWYQTTSQRHVSRINLTQVSFPQPLHCCGITVTYRRLTRCEQPFAGAE